MSAAAKEKDTVEFPLPVVEKLPSQKPDLFKSRHDSDKKFFEDAKIYCQIEGFDEGAIVVLKNQGKHARLNPANWGIVVRIKDWASTTHNHTPICVRWCSYTKTETEHDMSQLLLIHSAREKDEIERLFDLQEIQDVQC